MIDFNAIKISLQEWVVRSTILTDSTVVFSDQNAPRPNKSYISMKILSIIDIGQRDARLPADVNGDSEFVGNKEFTLSMQCHGTDALNILSTLKDSLNAPTELQTLRDNGVVFVDQLLFTDITALLETIWEERGQLDLLFRTVSTSTHNVGIIERVNIDGDYLDANGDVSIDNSFTVTDPDAIAGPIIEVDNSSIVMSSEEVSIIP